MMFIKRIFIIKRRNMGIIFYLKVLSQENEIINTLAKK